MNAKQNLSVTLKIIKIIKNGLFKLQCATLMRNFVIFKLCNFVIRSKTSF